MWEIISVPVYKPAEQACDYDPLELDTDMASAGPASTSSSSASQDQTLYGWPDRISLLVITLFFTSIISCERVFHTMGFTYGLCGPLELTPNLAVVTDKSYNGGFLFGRYECLILMKESYLH